MPCMSNIGAADRHSNRLVPADHRVRLNGSATRDGDLRPSEPGLGRGAAQGWHDVEGRLRHTMKIRDGWRDSSLFSMLADEWRTLTHNGLQH